jgi:hypothetical protein
MRKFIPLLLILSIAAWRNETWFLTPSGLNYRILYSSGRDPVTRPGGIAKVRYIQLFHDKIRHGTGGQMPVYQVLIPGFLEPYSFMEPLAYGLHEGDTVEIAQRFDSLIAKHQLHGLPPGAQKSDELITRLVVERAFQNDLSHPGRMDSLVAIDKAVEQHRLDSLYCAHPPQKLARPRPYRHRSYRRWRLLTHIRHR